MKYNSMKRCAMIAMAVTLGISSQSVFASDQITTDSASKVMFSMKETTTQETMASAQKKRLPLSGTVYRVTASSLNIYSGPGTNYSHIGSYKKYDVVNVRSISKGWAQVSFRSRTGYVYAKYLEKYI